MSQQDQFDIDQVTAPIGGPPWLGQVEAAAERPPAELAAVAVKLAEELMWKLDNPRQHATGADQALADFLESGLGSAELREQIRRWLA